MSHCDRKLIWSKITTSLQFQEACIEKIVRFISGDERREGSLYSYGRQNTYQRTISQDSTANSIRSESDNLLNCHVNNSQ